jgi:hypothetical protein
MLHKLFCKKIYKTEVNNVGNEDGKNCNYVKFLKDFLNEWGKENGVIQGKIIKTRKTVGAF